MAHFNFVISQNAKWGHAGFYIDCHRMTVPENILLQEKHCAEPLAIMFQESFQSAILPFDSANIVPIFIKGDKTDPNNYRPVSLPSVPCKIMESIIKDSITTFLEQNQIVSHS